MIGMTELTAQNPVASQMDSVVRLAQSVAEACSRAAARLGTATRALSAPRRKTG